MGLGCCCCAHARAGDKTITRWQNTTQMLASVGSGSFVDPYAILTEICDSGSCTEVACGSTGDQPCWPFDKTVYLQGCTPSDTVAKIIDNCFTKTSETVDRSVCRKVGFKAFQAEKIWQGMVGFKQCACTAITTKYRSYTITFTGIIVASDTPCDQYYSYDEARTYTVGAGGVVTLTGATCNSKSFAWAGHDDGWVSTPIDPPGLPDYLPPDCECTEPATYTFWKSQTDNFFSDFTCENDLIEWEFKNGVALTTQCSDPDHDGPPVVDGGMVISAKMHFKIQLGSPYTLSDVISELSSMLDAFDMTDDQRFPWRTDSDCSRTPLIRLREKTGNPNMGLGPCDYVDTDTYNDGSTEGTPTPAGYDRYWNPDQPVYDTVGCGSGGPCTLKRGESSPFESATAWTDNLWSTLLRPGAWIEYGTPTTLGTPLFDKVRVQKWAEILLPWSRVNLNRPCGKDVGLLDSDASECIVSFSDPTLDLEGDIDVTGTELFAIASSDFGIDPGVYPCTRPGSAQLSLGAIRYPIPSWMEFAHDNKASKLRWAGKFGLCSTRKVLTAVDNLDGTVTITTDKDCYLFGRGLDATAGESLDFTGVSGLTTAEVISASDLRTFIVAGALSGAYTSGGTVICTGYDDANDVWDTNAPAYTYVRRSWDQTGSISEAAATLTPIHSAPSVLCYSPNGETWDNGVTIAPSWGITVDECVTSTLQQDFLQVETDPYWKIPPRPCTGDPWASDDGTCLDSSTHYPHGPLTAPMLTLPVGAPTLADGITLHTPGGQPGPGNCAAPWIIWLALSTHTDCNGYGDWWKAY